MQNEMVRLGTDDVHWAVSRSVLLRQVARTYGMEYRTYARLMVSVADCRLPSEDCRL